MLSIAPVDIRLAHKTAINIYSLFITKFRHRHLMSIDMTCTKAPQEMHTYQSGMKLCMESSHRRTGVPMSHIGKTKKCMLTRKRLSLHHIGHLALARMQLIFQLLLRFRQTNLYNRLHHHLLMRKVKYLNISSSWTTTTFKHL
jgi:hypothetical protein